MVDDSEVEDALKNGGWKAMKDPGTGKTYYYNKSLGKTTWNLKKELEKSKSKANDSKSKSMKASDKKTAEPAADVSVKQTKEKKELEQVETKKKEDDVSSVSGVGAVDSQQQIQNETPGENSSSNPGGENTSSAVAASTRDPISELTAENERLKQLVASGSQGVIAHEMLLSVETFRRSNEALKIELERARKEKDTMEEALLAANKRVQEQQIVLIKYEAMIDPHIESEAQSLTRTLTYLREQNASLVRQVSELSVLLARGLHAQSAMIDKWMTEVSLETGIVLRNHLGSDSTASTALSNTETESERFITSSARLPFLERLLETSTRDLLCATCQKNVERAKGGAENALRNLNGRSEVTLRSDVVEMNPLLRNPAPLGLHGPGSSHALPAYAVYDPVDSRNPYYGHLVGASQRPGQSQASIGAASTHLAGGNQKVDPSSNRPVYYEGYLVRNPQRR